jgi:predicted amino acid-binding ACT domain protein
MPKAQTDAEWSDRAKNLLRSELKRMGVTYAQLSDLLEQIGVQENEKNIANKISRGVFTMAFFLQCMAAIEVTELRL